MTKIDAFFIGLLAPMGLVLAMLMVIAPSHATERGTCEVGTTLFPSTRGQCLLEKNGRFYPGSITNVDSPSWVSTSGDMREPQCGMGRELVIRMSGHYACAVDVKEME